MGKRQAPRKLDALSEDSDSVNFSGDENSVDLTAAKSSTVPDCDETNAVRNCAVRKSGKRRKSRHEVLARHRDDLLFVHDRKDTSASMENVLTQALVSKDKQMLDSVLAVEDLLVIRRTISELPSVQIEGFIEQLVARFNETPLRMRTLGPWLRELLRQHISSSASIPSIQKNLFKIYYHASARLRYHHTAVKLQGELDALTYSAYRRIEEKQDREKSDDDWDKPLLVFREATDDFHEPSCIAKAFHTYYQNGEEEPRSVA